MKTALPNNVYIVRETGLPVEGRLKVYLHESNTYATVYTLEGADYVQAENPQLLHAGLPEATLFIDAGVVDLVVQQYIGPEGAMSVESPDDDFATVDEFQYGLDFDPGTVDHTVDTVDELRDTDPSVGVVRVLWYAEAGDCPVRFYVWDAASQNAEDGGYIIASSVSDTGRWILMWGDEVLPATVYGVRPGDESNLNLLLNYPDVVGSFQLRTAPSVRFPAGRYTSNISITTSRELCFDAGAYFKYASFTCPRVRTFGAPSTYLADFTLTGANAEAHSAWFRTVNAFWHCGANTFYLDVTNYFQDSELNTSVDLLNKVIIGCKRIPMTYATGAYLQIRGCGIYGHRIFSPTADIIRFRDTCFDQEWFTKANFDDWDFGLLSQGHRIQLLTSDGNTIDYANFWQPDVYLRACLGNGDTTFDGHNLSYSTYVNDQFTTIRNCRFSSGTHFTDSKCDDWDNVVVSSGIEFTGHDRITLMNECKFGLSSNTDSSAIKSMSISKSEVVNGGVWNVSETALAVYDSRWAPGLTISEAAKTSRTHNKSVSFTRTVFTDSNSTMWLNDISLQSCTCCEHIYLVPYYADSKFKHNCVLRDNRFIGNFRLDVAPKDMANESDVYHTYCTLIIENNRFEQTDSKGIWLPYVTNNGDWAKLYVESGIGSTFVGNTGNCPGEKPYHLYLSKNMTESYTVSSGNDNHYLPVSTYAHRMWNMSTTQVIWPNVYGWQCEPSSDSRNPYTGRSAEMHQCAMLHVPRVDLSDEYNDQFLVVHCWSDNDDFDDDMLVVFPSVVSGGRRN